jgi:hypothetical protein
MGGVPTTAPRPAVPVPTLLELKSDVTVARDVVRRRRRAPVVPADLTCAHADLTAALEAYTAELRRRRLPLPPRLRDELRLHRLGQLATDRGGWAGSAHPRAQGAETHPDHAAPQRGLRASKE